MNTNELDNYFTKKFAFPTNNYKLPTEVFTCEKWRIEELQQMKTELNTVKEKLNDYDLPTWSKHTRYREPSSFLISYLHNNYKIELLTQAWCKFYECLSRFDLITDEAKEKQRLRSVHLCEAPGAFITALNHYLASKYPFILLSWTGNTLNPNYEGNSLQEMVADDRLILRTEENWNFGIDGTGDLTKFDNYQHLVKEVLCT